jgi:GT2 family glycosyltransferase
MVVSPSHFGDRPSPRTVGYPLVYVVVLNYNRADLTRNCVESALRMRYANFRIIVVDNGSADDSVQRLKAVTTGPRVELMVNERNEGYAGGNNRGIEKALCDGAEYVFILNNDTVVDAACLCSLVSACEADPRIAIAGCKIENLCRPLTIDRGSGISLFTGKAFPWRHDEPVLEPVSVDFACGAAIMLRAKVLRRIGAFDSNFFAFYEDADICFRARTAGYKVCFVPGGGVRHLPGATARAAGNRALVWFCLWRNRIWFVRRHGRLKHRIALAFLTFCYQYPKMLVAHALRGESNLLWPLLKAVWSGYWAYRGYPGPAGAGRTPPLSLQQSECES